MSAPLASTVAVAHTITVAGSGQQFTCPEGKSVLVGMEHRGGRSIQVGCRNGGCGVCRVEVLSGTYTSKKMSKAHVTESDLERNIVLSCRIFPTSDLVVRPCPLTQVTGAPIPQIDAPAPPT